ncbi:DUF6134 family protein [Chitinophaga cymbidii]|uniref:DUF3108 domain-containing protein n=1 Tax=Chitinophaga cymbidii TaxID=1096750 RepID=A0A512RG25_9BACT|nr:DUF6134 family protein [Chitinophaga cymbidii]GEP94652.1 hypothetical protein CCY01nite_09120 [Chitinophaga cymbidii]
MSRICKPYAAIRTFLLLLCGWVPLLTALGAAGQTRIYDIRYGNNAIGTLETKQETTGSTRRITLKSRVQMKLLSRMEVDIFAEYRHNVLHAAKATRLQGKSSADSKETSTEKSANGYTVIRKGERSILHHARITYCVSDLYFTEPREIRQVYSETLGVLLPLKLAADKRYELTMPDGKRSYYRYEKGKLKEVEISHALGKAFFTAREGA